MATCNDCRWKIERNECPYDYMYDEEDVDYAEDCIDFRNINLEETKFTNQFPIWSEQ